MINDDKDSPSWPSFLIDLDLAIKEQRVGVSGATERPARGALWQLARFWARNILSDVPKPGRRFSVVI